MGKGNESDPTNASANVSADALADTLPTHHRRVGRHITNASADTLPTRRPTHYRRVGRHTTDASANTLQKGKEKIAIPAMIRTITLHVKQGIKGKDS